MANFSALNTGLSALIAHRKAAETISHNIANVNTEGFSRRRVDLSTEGIGAVAAVYARGLNTGNGVKVDGITRIRDDFLEAQYRNESSTNSNLTGAKTILNRIESAVPEPSDDGISEQLQAFWGSFDGVVNQPDSEAARQSVLSKGTALVKQIQSADAQIRTVQGDAVSHIAQSVDQVNQYATQIASLNKAIKAATVANLSPNDLMDQRDLLINKVADLTGATVATGDYNEIEIFVGGRALVHGDTAEALQTVQVTDPTLTPVGLKRVEVQWAIDNYPANRVGGEIGGYVAGANVSAPKYLAALDKVANQLVTSVNAIHTTGNDLDGVTGRNFFDPAGTTAQTLAISADVAGQPRHVAAAAVGAGVLDTSIAEQLAGLKQSTTGADVAYRSMVTGLGTEVQYYEQQGQVQGAVVQRLDQDRKNVSGVNLDEEMVNLVAEQHAYSAAARVITTIDEMLDTLINRTGRVGL